MSNFKKYTIMKKMLFTLVTMLTIAVSANAMSYEQARREALFLTDKMAYELNLTDAQYEAAYEINLDYLMGVTSYSDVFGTYWERRNLDLSYILYTWQWDLFRAATYFYRPLYWEGGYWHFGIYARYPHRDYFYFGYPGFYVTYRGGHSWRHNGGRSWYEGRHDHFRPDRPRDRHEGMRNHWDRGDYRDRNHGRSSTRVTGGNDRGGRDNGGVRDNNRGRDNNGGVRDNNGGRNNNGGVRDNNGGVRDNGGRTVNRGTVDGRSVNGGAVERGTVERRSVGSSTVERRSVNSGSVERRSVERGSSSVNRSVGSVSRNTGSSVSRGSSSSSVSRGSAGGSVSRGSSSGSVSRGGGSVSRGSAGGGGSRGGGSRSGGGRR